MLLAVVEKEMDVFNMIQLQKRSILTGTNIESDDCITCSTQDENNGVIREFPIFTNRYGRTKQEFINEVFRLNGF